MSREKLGKVNRNAGPYQGKSVAQLPLPAKELVVTQSASPVGQGIAAQCLIDLECAAGFEDDIYYKLVPSDGGKAVHCYAYWKRGEWNGFYVYALALHGDLAGALAALARKVAQVRAGLRRPSLDTRKGTRSKA